MSAYIAGRVAAVIAQQGETMTLRRAGQSDLPVRAKIYGATDSTVVNTQGRVTRTILISNSEIAAASWPGPPRAKDQLVDGASKTWIVQDCDTRSHGGVVQNHRMTVVGSA
jgi:hypothetical protein